MRPSPIPAGRSEGEPSAFAPPEAGGSTEHHPRAFQQPTTDAAARPVHLREQAAAGAVEVALAANGQEVSAALHHGADVTAPDFICHDGLPRSSTLNRSEMGEVS